MQNMKEIKGHIMFSEVKELHVSIFERKMISDKYINL